MYALPLEVNTIKFIHNLYIYIYISYIRYSLIRYSLISHFPLSCISIYKGFPYAMHFLL